MASQYPPSLRIHLPLLLLLLQVGFILIFLFFISYDHNNKEEDLAIYPALQDVNVMVVSGFAFLLAFLRRYGFSSTGFTLLLAALGVQWTVIVDGFLFNFSGGKVKINLQSILTAIMSVTAVLISSGAVLGKVNLLQLIWMAMVELTAFTVNRWIAVDILKIGNHESLMHVHLFGTYFGLMASWKCCHSLMPKLEKQRSQPVSDKFAMLGTLFLWVFWPTFNSALLKDGVEKGTAIYNTYFAIAASTLTAFSFSVATNSNGKLCMADIQTATLAGGVALGFPAPIIQHPWIAIVLGLLAGAISVAAVSLSQKCLESAIGIHDTRGVHYTFGLPSLLGGIVHVILIVIDNWENLSVLGYSALIKIGALSLSIAIGLVAGVTTGFSLKCKLWKAVPVKKYFDDQAYWEFPHLATGY
uniref:Ammonium transporter AmtB-like domain-containing protein n=1 Tax=Salvator merianae TaxID=96440 RepID=A0A8D0DJ31_SALMN